MEKVIRDTLGKDCKQEDLDKLFKLKNEPMLQLGTRLVRIYANQYDNFKKLLITALGDMGCHFKEEYLKGYPLIATNNSPDTLRVFPTLLLDDIATEKLKTCSSLLYWNVIAGLYNQYKEDIKDERKAKGWESTKRIWGRLKKYEDMPTARILTRYTGLQKHSGFSDAQIRDIATAIDEIRKPMELIYCNTPKDYIAMYTGGPDSCMAVKPGTESNRFMWSQGVHACSYYHYHPHTQGVYAKFKGKVAARTILYTKEDGKQYYGRVFHSNDKIHQRFVESLVAAGHNALHPGVVPDKHRYGRQAEFEIPAVEYQGHYYCPLPYMDNLHEKCYMEWDSVNKKFKVSQGPDTPKSNIVVTQQSGYINSNQLGTNQCHLCRKLIQAGRGHTTVDGDNYCSKGCFREAGYVEALRSDGTYGIVVKTPEIIVDCLDRVTCYTNAQSAKDNHCLPFVDDINFLPEGDEQFTRHGNGLLIDGTLYAINANLVEILLDAGKIARLSQTTPMGNYTYKLKDTKKKLKVNIETMKSVDIPEMPELMQIAA
jgi:hypothetical protein